MFPSVMRFLYGKGDGGPMTKLVGCPAFNRGIFCDDEISATSSVKCHNVNGTMIIIVNGGRETLAFVRVGRETLAFVQKYFV